MIKVQGHPRINYYCWVKWCAVTTIVKDLSIFGRYTSYLVSSTVTYSTLRAVTDWSVNRVIGFEIEKNSIANSSGSNQSLGV